MNVNNLSRYISFVLLFTLCGFTPLFGQASENKLWTKDFFTDKRDFASEGMNRYFILKPGYQLKLEGQEEGQRVTLFITVLDETKQVDGVETRIVEERELKNGELIELSRNFFALNKKNYGIFYFGEEVDIYKNGKLVGHEGAWQSGENGAKYGLMMPAIALTGSRYYQEIAPDVAMDRAEILSVDDTLKTPAGFFENCVTIEETTPLEPKATDYKIYAPGVGIIKDGSLLLVKSGFVERKSSGGIN